MDTGPISSATAVDSTQYRTSFSSTAEMPVALSSTSDVDRASTTASTDPSTSPGPVTSPSTSDVDQASATSSTGLSTSAPPAAPVSASLSAFSIPSAGSVSAAQSAFLAATTHTISTPAPVPTTMIIATSMVPSPWVTMSIHITIPTTTTTLPTVAKPHATADSKHDGPYQKQHEKQVIGGAIGGGIAVFLVMCLLLWLFLYLRRNWMRCKRRCQICRLRRTSSNDSKRSGDSKSAESGVKCIPKKVRFKEMCLPSCCRPRIAEGDDFMQEIDTHDPTGAPRFSNIPHRRPARYASFFGQSGNQDFQTPTTGRGTTTKAQKSRHEKEASRHKTLKVSNPDPNAPVPSDSGSSASKDATAAPGFVAGPEYDPGDPDAMRTISNEATAGMESEHSLNSDWGVEPSPEKRKSLSPLKPALLARSNSRPKPKKSILKRRRKHSPELSVEPASDSKESGEGLNASSSGEGPSKPPTNNLKFSFDNGFSETVSSTADIGMLELKDLTSPQRETRPIPSQTPNESPDPTQTLKDSIDHRAEMRKRKSALRGSADSKQGLGEDRKGSAMGQETIADDYEKPESAIRSEARGSGTGDTERQTKHPQDCTENPSPSEQAESPS